jgi:multiple sugar transport system permease protein
MDNGWKYMLRQLIRWIVLAILALAFILPLVLMITMSFKSPVESVSGVTGLIVTEPTMDNYKEALSSIPYGLYMKNTLVIAILSVLGQVIVCPMAAYSIAKIQWKGARIITTLLLATMMLPYFTIMVPLYKIWSSIGLTGTPWPLILCNLFGNSFYIIIVWRFMLGIPDSVLEAATIDGCNEFQRFIHIVLPLLKPALATIAILSFVANWSDYLNPMLYLTNQSDYTLSLGLYSFMGQHSVNWTLLMAAATIFIIPAVVVFIVFQKYFVKGISITGLK